MAGATAQIGHTGPPPAEERDTCGGRHTTADQLTCYVTFDGVSELADVEVEFNLQAEGGGNCVLRESRQIDNRTYAVSGSLSTCPPGWYMLAGAIASRGKAYRLYQAGFGLSSEIVLEIERPVLKQKPEQPPSEVLDRHHFGHKSITAQEVKPCITILPEITAIRSAPNAEGTVARVTRLFRQSKNRCGGRHVPGDRLACYLQFGQPTDLSRLVIGFEMDDRDRLEPYADRPRDQQGLCTSFVFFEDYRKIDSRTYEISGILPACGSARYFLSEVTAFGVGDTDHNCAVRDYISPADIKKPPTFRLKNPNQTLFPELAEISGSCGNLCQVARPN